MITKHGWICKMISGENNMQNTINRIYKNNLNIKTSDLMSSTISRSPVSMCFADSNSKELLPKSLLCELITNQHPVMLCWLAISFILFCSMFIYSTITFQL
ncbi:MAG: hypothetical protein PHV37_00660 [Candidatus Gastranaerophilales bacterium]|nr:hypothetical protein [Candidatus Gastranaerophilales bacterium]